MKPLSRMPEGRFRCYLALILTKRMPAPTTIAFAQKREWAPVGGKIVGQTSTTVLGLALQRTFTFRFRLVP